MSTFSTLSDARFPDEPQFTALAYGGRQPGQGDVPDVLVAGTATGRLYVRGPQGPVIREVPQPGLGPIRAIAVEPNDWRRVFILSGDQVFATNDISAAQPVFTNITGALAETTSGVLRSLSVIDTNPGGPGTLLAGGLGGVYRFNPNQGDWSRLAPGLPDAVVTSIQYTPASDLLAAATFGRGAWQLTGVRALVGS
jgi:hypothetical protein